MKKCVFSGTFDPPTKGHLKTVLKCLEIFDSVVVAVMRNPDKEPLLSLEQRLHLLGKLFAGESRVKIRAFDGAAVDLLREENTEFYVRGVRNTVDFEYENQNNFASMKLDKSIITVYIPADQEDLHISSSAARTCIEFGKDFKEYIPERILGDLKRILEK